MQVDLKSMVMDDMAIATLRCVDKKGKIHTKDVTVKRYGKETKHYLELSAILTALKCLKTKCELHIKPMQIQIDSAIRLGWAKDWQKHNWTTKTGRPPRDAELWEQILEELEKHAYEVKNDHSV